MSKQIPASVKIVEVGPRDGLQNESTQIPVAVKVELIERLANAGLSVIEAASFVSPKWVPQMAGSSEVMQTVTRKPGVVYTALTPNLKGFEAALDAGVEEVAIFAAASETFSQKNINCSIAESIERYNQVVDAALAKNLTVRGYISCVMGCPYEGEVDVQTVAKVAHQLFEKGCYEISLGDTIGTGNPEKTRQLIETVSTLVPVEKLAVHFHDTYGQALANIHAALCAGIAVVDSSIAGLGGCPYAKGASGNVATEDVVYMLHGMQIKTGINLEKLLDASEFICEFLQRSPASKAAQALLAKRQTTLCH